MTEEVEGTLPMRQPRWCCPAERKPARGCAHARYADIRTRDAPRVAGRRVSEIGRAVERKVSSHGFSVLRELTGHGVGRRIHEAPTVANYFDPFQRDVLTEGLVLTIEPLISERRTGIAEDADGWTLRTRNGCLGRATTSHTLLSRRVPSS